MLDAQRRMQDGVASYAQLTASGLSRIDIDRAVRRNEFRRVHPRVYVNHSGPLTWEQRAWAAVLYARLKVEDNALAMANEARSEIDAIARVAEVASRPMSPRPRSRRHWIARTPYVAASSSRGWWTTSRPAPTRCSSTMVRSATDPGATRPVTPTVRWTISPSSGR